MGVEIEEVEEGFLTSVSLEVREGKGRTGSRGAAYPSLLLDSYSISCSRILALRMFLLDLIHVFVQTTLSMPSPLWMMIASMV